MHRCALPRQNHIQSRRKARRVARAVGVTAVVAGAMITASPTARAAESATIVQIRDYNFAPDRIAVGVNEPIAFQNTGATIHRIVADDGSFDSRDLSPGTGFQTTIATAGTVRMHCEIHPSMTATVVVTSSPSATGSTIAPTATTGPLPTKLAQTGVGDTMLVVTAGGCLAIGFFAMSLHRRRQSALASMPSEAAWRAVTVGQRHHDDLIARRRH
jgi:plastocyanin